MPKGLTRGDLQLCKSVRIIIPRFRSEVHHRQALFEMRAQARMKKGPGGENFDRRSLR